jgi:predicted unusual protein kinase regulating ubiquinone biosynthesis (AarF/ABC1/UbiB family)
MRAISRMLAPKQLLNLMATALAVPRHIRNMISEIKHVSLATPLTHRQEGDNSSPYLG